MVLRASATHAHTQVLSAAQRSLQEVVASLCGQQASSASRYTSSAAAAVNTTSTTTHHHAAVSKRALPDDGPGLADFIRASNGGGSSSWAGGDTAQQADMSKRVFIETYGCQMNVSDSEVISSILAAQQYSHAESAAAAGVVLLNTCAIR